MTIICAIYRLWVVIEEVEEVSLFDRAFKSGRTVEGNTGWQSVPWVSNTIGEQERDKRRVVNENCARVRLDRYIM